MHALYTFFVPFPLRDAGRKNVSAKHALSGIACGITGATAFFSPSWLAETLYRTGRNVTLRISKSAMRSATLEADDRPRNERLASRTLLRCQCSCASGNSWLRRSGSSVQWNLCFNKLNRFLPRPEAAILHPSQAVGSGKKVEAREFSHPLQ